MTTSIGSTCRWPTRRRPDGWADGSPLPFVPCAGGSTRVQQSVGLYPTAASSDDYAYSRHMVDPRKGKIIAFTMEWGRSHAVTPFHPPYPEMRKVMREVTAGLLECCLQASAVGRAARAR
jgi:hypothetical protein